MAREPTAAGQIWPNLPHDDGRMASWAGRERTESVAQAMYPQPTKAQPQPQPWQPKPDFRDWSGIDVRYARLLGLVPKRRG